MAKAMFATLVACFMTIGLLASEHEPAPAHDQGHSSHDAPAEHHEAVAEEHGSSEEHVAEEHVAEAHAAPAKAAPQKPGFWKRFYETSIVGQYIEELRLKVEHAAHVDAENEQLRKRLSEIEVRFSSLEHQALKCQEQARAEKIKEENKNEGGTEAARTIASLKTFDEKLLSRPPHTIYEEAIKAFAKDDFETAGKALTFLADNEENDTYQSVQVFYLTGVSLYKVGNYKRALGYLDRAREHASGEELSYAPRTLGWIALCQKKLSNAHAEKQAIKELMEKYPKSKEARRLNRDA